MKKIRVKKSKMARLEARVSVDEKGLFQQAAALKGQTLTEFLVSCAHTGRTVQEHEVLTLSARDRKAFVAALLKPPSPGKRLENAVRCFKETMSI